jgi:hypothetical protein
VIKTKKTFHDLPVLNLKSIYQYPHLYCVMPGGGLWPDRQRWISWGRNVLLTGEGPQPETADPGGHVSDGTDDEHPVS